MRSVLFWVAHPPYSTNHLAEAIRAATMSGALDLEVSFAFVKEGVWAVVGGQAPHLLGPPIERTLQGLVTDRAPVLVDAGSLAARGLGPDRVLDRLPSRIVSATELAERLARADRVVTF